MMKEKMKKITALLLVAVMFIGVVVNSDVMTNYASSDVMLDQLYETDIVPSVKVDSNLIEGDINCIRVSTTPTDEFAYTAVWVDRPVRIAGGVYVDGELNTSCTLIKFPSFYYIALSDGVVNVQEGTTVVFDGIYGRGATDGNYGDGYTVKFNKATFQYTGSGWEQILDTEEPDVTVDTTVDVTLVSGDTNLIMVHGSPEDNLPCPMEDSATWGTNAKRVTGGIYVDGSLNTSCNLMKLKGEYYVVLDGGAATVTKGTTVVLDGIYSNEAGDYFVKFNKAIFEYTEDGWKQLYETDIVPSVKVNSNLIEGDMICIRVSTTPTDELAYTADWVDRPARIAGGVYVDGELNTGCTLIKFSSFYYISLSDGNVNVKEGTTVVFDGIYGSSDYAVKFNEATFQYMNGAWVQIFTADAIVDPAGNGKVNGIFIYTNVPDGLEVTDENWAKRHDLCSGGIYVDDELNSSCTQLIKLAAAENYSQYYIDTWNIRDSIKDGTKVVVDGVFGSTQRIKVNKATFVYDGTTEKWEQVSNGDLGTTGIVGDADANNSSDVIDLVRMLRYTEADTDEINLTDADLNKDSHVNEKDIQLKKEILVGKTTFNNGYNITEKPQYEENKRLSIGAYCGPRRGTAAYTTDWRTDEQFAQYAEAGFNMVISELDAVYGKNYNSAGTESVVKNFSGSDLDKYMNLANKYGIDVIVGSQALNNVLNGATTLENADVELTTMLSALRDKTNFKGIMMSDEPGTSCLSNYRTVSKYLNTKSAMQGKTMFTSLYPYCTDERAFGSIQGTDKEEKYMNYLKEFGSYMGLVNYDFYPFEQDNSKQDSMRSDYFKNLEMAALTAQETGESGVTIQAFASYNKTTGIYSARKLDKKAYYTYQLYASLAYGMKNITYFSYWNHYYAESGSETLSYNMINADGSKNETVYNFVKEANTEIRGFDKVYMDFNWQGTMKVAGSDNDGLLAEMSDYTNPHIASVTATNDTIIGCLKDSKGYDGFMLVNATDPSDRLSSQVTVTFKDAQKAIVYVEGVKGEVELTDGKYTVTLAPGAGVFVIPYSGEEEDAEATVNSSVKVDSYLISGDTICITMWTAPTDELAYTSDWVDRPERLSGGVYVDGTLNTSCALIKFKDYYYIALSDGKVNVQEGTTVVFSGIYGRQNGVDSAYGDNYTVEFNRAVFVYRDGSWVQCSN